MCDIVMIVWVLSTRVNGCKPVNYRIIVITVNIVIFCYYYMKQL